MAENKYQAGLIKRLSKRFPGSVIMKNDPNYIQGIPDLTILYEDCWATLEVKDGPDAPSQPNQEHYVAKMNEMSFSAFVYPAIEERVMDELQRSFESRRKTRISQPK
jgi:hypothetical protein